MIFPMSSQTTFQTKPGMWGPAQPLAQIVCIGPVVLLYSWIMQVRNSHKCSGVGLFLFHDVWHLSLEVSWLTVTQWWGLKSPGDIFTHIFNIYGTGCHLWPHTGLSIKASTNGLSLWSGLSYSGFGVTGLLISCPSLESKLNHLSWPRLRRHTSLFLFYHNG